jgi:hypothetical protein
MCEWLPIETAPRDTKIDVWQCNRRYVNAFWHSPWEMWCIDSVYGPDEPTPLAIAPPTTHWMPLPLPPETMDSSARMTNEQVARLVNLSLEMLAKANNPPMYLRPEDMYRPDSDLDTRMRKIVAFARREQETTLGAGVKAAMATVLEIALEGTTEP